MDVDQLNLLSRLKMMSLAAAAAPAVATATPTQSQADAQALCAKRRADDPEEAPIVRWCPDRKKILIRRRALIRPEVFSRRQAQVSNTLHRILASEPAITVQKAWERSLIDMMATADPFTLEPSQSQGGGGVRCRSPTVAEIAACKDVAELEAILTPYPTPPLGTPYLSATEVFPFRYPELVPFNAAATVAASYPESPVYD